MIPLQKQGDKTNPTNYGPISILACFSKIFERVIYSRFTKFFSKHKVIYEAQYLFQKNISTVHAVLDIVSTTFRNINENHFTVLTLFNLQKAFDTVPRDILLAKLEHYDIHGPAQSLMQAFLKRQQFVCINGTNFTIRAIPYDVAQGLTLGPLLFLLYITDVPKAITGTPRLFADNTYLISDNVNPKILLEKMSLDLESVHNWCIANKLSLNPAKSFFLIIPPKLNRQQPFIPLNVNDTPPPPSKSVKYLGIYIDKQLNFKCHIGYIEQKISRSVDIHAKLKSFLLKPAVLKLYCTLVHFHLLYGLAISGSIFLSFLNKLA